MPSNTRMAPKSVLVHPKNDSDPRSPLVDGVRIPLVMSHGGYQQFMMGEQSQRKTSPSASGYGTSYHSSPPLPRPSGGDEVEPISPLATSPLRHDNPATIPDVSRDKQAESATPLEDSFSRLTFGVDAFASGHGVRPIPFPRPAGMVDIAGNFIPIGSRGYDSVLNQYFEASDLAPSPAAHHVTIYRQPAQSHQLENGNLYHKSPVLPPWPPGLIPAMVMRAPPGLMGPQQAHHNIFRPMQAAATCLQPKPETEMLVRLRQMALLPCQTSDSMEKVMNGFSPNYMGNIHIDKNKSANIPESENCSLWLTKLPPNLTYTDLLAVIRDVGRVYQTHINRPQPDKGHHTSAGKIVFFDRASAERFFERFADSGLVFPGYPGFTGRVAWNRVLAAAVDGPGTKELSRVLLISGPKEMVTAEYLTQYFRSKLDFNIDCIIDHGGDDYRATVEYRFGSFRCQAESAKMAVTREMARHNVQVWFWTDPCDVGAETGQLMAESAGQGSPSGQQPARTAVAWR
ncbi:hypothetical protein DL546_008782 [Coniochaeta pulveracea]|uniref:Uncharacterized protein n=1 Tax=Coniochaeta pulveracea TaxID=177199 RepID=A0A420YM25_9PEZI|nr:hypothetical protein DL546_008782 [Coniochaeta pulveracea]